MNPRCSWPWSNFPNGPANDHFTRDGCGASCSCSCANDGTLSAGLEYTFPLDKRIDRENRDSAARQLELLGRLKAYRMESIAEQVRRAHRDVQTAKTSVDILSQNVQVARDNLKLAQRMVEEGLDDNRNVLEAQDSLTKVESGLLSARAELYLSSINLKLAMGEDLAAVGSE